MAGTERAPYPGLRSFRADESDIFFGRDDCIDAMLARLAATRFLAVLGSSGIGKSSLVKTGLLAALQMGLLRGAGSSWLVVEFRPVQPEGSPLCNLARGLLRASGEPVTTEAVDRMRTQFMHEGPRALLGWCREGHLPTGTNLLLLVDQFEELFRYQDYSSREEAEAFVALLLESRQPLEASSPQMAELPIYVTLTMRSEFLGACSLVQRLPEAITEGAYLTPRMTREQYREAIVGPAEVCGIKIEEILVNRILNDLAAFAPWDQDAASSGDETGAEPQDQLIQLARRADQLPVLQHALNRAWRRAYERAEMRHLEGGEGASKAVELTLDDYRAIGGIENALNAHADAVLEEVARTEGAPVERTAERLFRALVAGSTPSEAVRRPTPLEELTEITEDEPGLHALLRAFRADECNFLMPEPAVPLAPETMIDISHESLIRQWKRLSRWVLLEAAAAQHWRRLNDRFNLGERLRGRVLGNLVAWRKETMPNAAWARRYGGGDFAAVIAFLNKSERTEKNWRFILIAIVASSFLGILGVAVFMFHLWQSALSERNHAQAAERTAVSERNHAQAAERDIGQVATLAREELSDVIDSYQDSVGDTLTWAPLAWQAYLHRQKSSAMEKLGDYLAAQKEIDLAEKMDPDYLPALVSSSDLAVIMGDADRAVRDTTAYLLVVKNNATAYGNIVLGEAMRRNYDEAVNWIEEAIDNARLPITDIESMVSPDVQDLTHGFRLSVPDSDFLLALQYTKAVVYAMKGDDRFKAAWEEADQSDRDRPYSRNAYMAALSWEWLIVRGQAIHNAVQAGGKDASDPTDELQDYGAYAIEGALWRHVAQTRPTYIDRAHRAFEKFQAAYRQHPQQRYQSLNAWVGEELRKPFEAAPLESSTVDDARALAQRAQELKTTEGNYPINFAPAFAQLSKAIDLLTPKTGSQSGRREQDLLVDLLLRRAEWRLQGKSEEVDRGGASDDARKVIALDPKVPDAYRLLAQAALDDDTRRANDEQALKLSPYDAAALEDMATLVQDVDSPTATGEALALLRKRQRVATTWSGDHLLLAKLYKRMGSYAQALRDIDSAIAKAPWKLDLYTERRDIERRMPSIDAATVELHYAQRLRSAANYEKLTGDDGLALKRYLLAFMTLSRLESPDADARFELESLVRDISAFLSTNYSAADAAFFWRNLSIDPVLTPAQQQWASQEASRLGHH